MENEIKDLVQENLEISKKMQAQTAYIKRYVILSQVLTLVKMLLIFVPIILGIIYIPPLLKDFAPVYESTIGVYKDALGMDSGTKMDADTAEDVFMNMSAREQAEIRNKICQ